MGASTVKEKGKGLRTPQTMGAKKGLRTPVAVRISKEPQLTAKQLGLSGGGITRMMLGTKALELKVQTTNNVLLNLTRGNITLLQAKEKLKDAGIPVNEKLYEAMMTAHKKGLAKKS